MPIKVAHFALWIREGLKDLNLPYHNKMRTIAKKNEP